MTNKALKAAIRDLLADRIADKVRIISISGSLVTVLFSNKRRLRAMLSLREGHEFYPRPSFAFTSDHRLNAEAVKATHTIAIAADHPKCAELVRHSDLLYIRDEDGQYVGIYGLKPSNTEMI